MLDWYKKEPTLILILLLAVLLLTARFAGHFSQTVGASVDMAIIGVLGLLMRQSVFAPDTVEKMVGKK